MLGETVREARNRKGLTQAKLAKLAGVSRRHLAALLELTQIHLGDLSLSPGEREHSTVNMPLLTDTIREARAEAERAQVILARAETMLGFQRGVADADPELKFPRMPIRRLELPKASNGDMLRDRGDWVDVATAGEVRHGEAIDEKATETVPLPRSIVDAGEIVFRASGDNMRDQGIENGDLLIVEPRPRGRASNGELVIGRIGRLVFIGRWWQKHGQKALLSNGLAEVTMGRSARSLRVVAAINQIVRF